MGFVGRTGRKTRQFRRALRAKIRRRNLKKGRTYPWERGSDRLRCIVSNQWYASSHGKKPVANTAHLHVRRCLHTASDPVASRLRVSLDPVAWIDIGNYLSIPCQSKFHTS